MTLPGIRSPGGESEGSAGGSAWSIEDHPHISVPQGTMSADSCTSRTSCVGVGSYVNGSDDSATLAEAWNGSKWTVQTAADVRGTVRSALSGISCSSRTACTAVGNYVNSSGTEVALAEAWNGTKWTVQTIPNPKGAVASELLWVSCSSATACTAVGAYFNSLRIVVSLAEGWNGTKWTVETTPTFNGAHNTYLNGIACGSERSCHAVGDYDSISGGEVPLAEAWNGTAWTVETTPDPKGAVGGGLNGVSCSSTVICRAVGFYSSKSGAAMTLAEVWNGTAWAVQTTANPTGAFNSYLDGVSCSSTVVCLAVGYYYDRMGLAVTLAEAWNGTAWTLQSTPNPKHATNAFLNGVSCSAPRACRSVGYGVTYYYATGLHNYLELAETWNGTTWSIETTPDPEGATASSLNSVSCTSPSACTAVGYYLDSSGIYETLAEGWNGTTWTVQQTPANSSRGLEAYLAAVSCRSASACIAVGYDSHGTLAERWNGTTWTSQAIPNPKGVANGVSYLSGVSCSSAFACRAVGYYFPAVGTMETFAEEWNGDTWTLQTTPNPAGSTFSSLEGVSCSSVSACTAVGNYLDSAGNGRPLAEVWNGTTWRIQQTPSPAGSRNGDLAAVSCSSPSACTATGQYEKLSFNDVAFAEVWNGTTWSVQSTPNPAGATTSALSAVSCSRPSSCTAVGEYIAGSGVDTALVAVRNGTTWSVQTTPSVTGATISSSGLNGVSCRSPGTCTAVGNYFNGNQATLIERENS